MEMRKYQVGEIIEQPKRVDLIQFDLTDSGAVLMMRYRTPSSKEKNNIKSGAAQFKLVRKDGILFFLSRFGTSPWTDAPYNPNLSNATLVMPAEGEGLALNILLIDSDTGKLMVQRLIGLSTQFSRILLTEASKMPPPQTYDEYLKQIHLVYAQSTTDDLVKDAFAAN